MGETDLNSLVAVYQSSGLGQELILAGIAAKLYREPRRYGFEGEDEAAEALFHYRRRIIGLADRYIDRGPPFEVYLLTSLRFLARTVRRERRKEQEREIVCERSERWSIESRSSGPFPPRPGGDVAGAPEGRPLGRGRSRPEAEALRKRLVFLYLKCAWEASDEATERVARAASVPADWLAAASAQCLRFLESERRRFEALEGKRDRSWAKLCMLEEKRHGELEPGRRAWLDAAIGTERERFQRAVAELKTFRPIVPNSVVARVLGVPKGTVDSGLYYLRLWGEERDRAAL